MNIQKTTGNINPKTTAQSSTRTAKPVAAQTAKPAAAQATVRSASSLISAAGLPSDKLSASIVSFARFFSLPLKPELLKNIRQQAFESAPNAAQNAMSSASSPEAATAEESGPKSEIVFKTRESLSLAAAAADGKGAELQPKALEAYAQAVDPDWRQRQDGGQGDQRGKRKREDNENGEEPLQKTAALNAADLKKTALEAEEKDPVLAILNRLPGRDGKRWVVLPFDFSDNGREFKVSLRILLETGKAANRADCMALDISESCAADCGKAVRNTAGSGETEKRRLFILEPANRLSVFLQPGVSAKEQDALAHELSALLEIAPERIFIKTQTEAFPFEAGRGDDFLCSIDEAV